MVVGTLARWWGWLLGCPCHGPLCAVGAERLRCPGRAVVDV